MFEEKKTPNAYITENSCGDIFWNLKAFKALAVSPYIANISFPVYYHLFILVKGKACLIIYPLWPLYSSNNQWHNGIMSIHIIHFATIDFEEEKCENVFELSSKQ